MCMSAWNTSLISKLRYITVKSPYLYDFFFLEYLQTYLRTDVLHLYVKILFYLFIYLLFIQSKFISLYGSGHTGKIKKMNLLSSRDICR